MDTQTAASQQAAPQGFDPADVDKNKALAIVGYIIPILFFIPLVTDAKNSAYAKFHANQQLALLLVAIVGYVISSILVVFLIGLLLMPLMSLALLVFAVMGIISAAQGTAKPLPLLGKIVLIK